MSRKTLAIILLLLSGAIIWFYTSPYGILQVHGQSMEPTMYENDRHIINQEPDMDELGEGDVIIYYDHKRDIFIAHRIVGETDESGIFVARGDNNPVRDEFRITEQHIVAEVVLTIPIAPERYL